VHSSMDRSTVPVTMKYAKVVRSTVVGVGVGAGAGVDAGVVGAGVGVDAGVGIGGAHREW
jgi:hypothetical protein